MTMTSTVLAGSTGLVGSQILKQLLSSPNVSSVNAYTRRELPNPTSSSKLQPLSATETSAWVSLFPRSPAPKVFLSALGTTRTAAGGVDAQRKIDLDLNYDLAKAAKDAGVETYVLISTSGANAKSMIGYSQMKGELDERVQELGFKHTVILRPGLIMGTREKTRPMEAVARGVAGGLKMLSNALVDSWAQEAEVIARAAVTAGLECAEGRRQEEGVWWLGQADVVKWGRKAPEA